MKITQIRIYAVPLPYKTFGHSRLKTPETTLHDTVVAVESDNGITGWGESCPLSPTYLPALPGALRAALDLLAPALLGHDPRNLGVIDHVMDATMLGHGYAKAALDMACWDAFGKATGLPLKKLLGGEKAARVPVYRSIPMDEPAAMIETVKRYRATGMRVFQVKLGQGAELDIERMRKLAEILQPGELMICDANRGWTMADARRVAMAADALDPFLGILLEQPCATYEESLTIRRMCQRPMVLDEVIDNMGDLIRAIADNAMDALVIKLSHAGGLTKAREMIAVALRSGIKLRIEDTVGAEFIRSAVAHLAVTIPPRMLLAAYPHPASIALGDGETILQNGLLNAGIKPGLGVTPDFDVLGEPIAVYEQ